MISTSLILVCDRNTLLVVARWDLFWYWYLPQWIPSNESIPQIHISSPDPYVPPNFDSGFLNNKADVAPLRWSYKKTREIARRMDGRTQMLVSFYSLLRLHDTSFPWRLDFSSPTISPCFSCRC